MDSSSKRIENTNIFATKATYYNPATHKWEVGTFTLNKQHFQFVNDDSIKDQFHLCIPLSTISGIEKRMSSFIYPAIVICIGSEKHWFSSFPNRDAVFNLMELFWREALFSEANKTVRSPKLYSANSSLGKELLTLLHESECSLIEAANALSDQGRQLHEVQDNAEDLNKDLDVVEKFLKKTTFPLSLDLKTPNNIKDQYKESKMKSYKVTFSFEKVESGTDNWQKGILAITDNMLLKDEQGNNILQISRNELEAFQVVSPWELCIMYSTEDTRKSCNMMCPQLSRLLKYLSSIPVLKEKINYAEDDTSLYETASCSSTSSFGSALSSPSSSTSDVNSTRFPNSNSDQVQQEISGMSDDDIQQISDVLSNLQALAAEVNKEQQEQMEKINYLISDMDRVELRMKADNKQVKKLM